MTAKAKRKPTRLTSRDVDLRRAGDILARLGGLNLAEGDPIAARAWFDGQRRMRRLKASWANGWKVTIGVRLDGSCSISWGLKLVTAAKGDAA